MRNATVVVLEGDGIGPEVVAVAREVVDLVASDEDLSITWDEHLMGGCSIDVHGTALTDEVLAGWLTADWVTARIANLYRAWQRELAWIVGRLGLTSVGALRGRSDLLRLTGEGPA